MWLSLHLVTFNLITLALEIHTHIHVWAQSVVTWSLKGSVSGKEILSLSLVSFVGPVGQSV